MAQKLLNWSFAPAVTIRVFTTARGSLAAKTENKIINGRGLNRFENTGESKKG